MYIYIGLGFGSCFTDRMRLAGGWGCPDHLAVCFRIPTPQTLHHAPESRIPNSESRIPNCDPESRIPNPESRFAIPNPGSRIPNPAFQIPEQVFHETLHVSLVQHHPRSRTPSPTNPQPWTLTPNGSLRQVQSTVPETVSLDLARLHAATIGPNPQPLTLRRVCSEMLNASLALECVNVKPHMAPDSVTRALPL